MHKMQVVYEQHIKSEFVSGLERSKCDLLNFPGTMEQIGANPFVAINYELSLRSVGFTLCLLVNCRFVCFFLLR